MDRRIVQPNSLSGRCRQEESLLCLLEIEPLFHGRPAHCLTPALTNLASLTKKLFTENYNLFCVFFQEEVNNNNNNNNNNNSALKAMSN
jgi:hypothetical protein